MISAHFLLGWTIHSLLLELLSEHMFAHKSGRVDMNRIPPRTYRRWTHFSARGGLLHSVTVCITPGFAWDGLVATSSSAPCADSFGGFVVGYGWGRILLET